MTSKLQDLQLISIILGLSPLVDVFELGGSTVRQLVKFIPVPLLPSYALGGTTNNTHTHTRAAVYKWNN